MTFAHMLLSPIFEWRSVLSCKVRYMKNKQKLDDDWNHTSFTGIPNMLWAVLPRSYNVAASALLPTINMISPSLCNLEHIASTKNVFPWLGLPSMKNVVLLCMVWLSVFWVMVLTIMLKISICSVVICETISFAVWRRIWSLSLNASISAHSSMEWVVGLGKP